MLDLQNGWMITDHNVLRTMDGGTTWHTITPPNASTLGFGTGFSFLDSNRGWILVPDQNDLLKDGSLYHPLGGGLSWLSYSVPFGSGNIKFLDDKNGWLMLIAGAGAGEMPIKLFQMNDGGRTWSTVDYQMPFPGEATYLTQPPVFFDPQNGILPMTAGHDGQATLFLKTIDGGVTWNASMPVTGAGQYAVVSPNDLLVWFAGEL